MFFGIKPIIILYENENSFKYIFFYIDPFVCIISINHFSGFHCHGSWDENGRSYLVTGLRNTGDKYCFVSLIEYKLSFLLATYLCCEKCIPVWC